jgi:hypothetical protein
VSDLKKQVEQTAMRLARTEYSSRADELAKTAPAVLDDMLKAQMDETISREQHIGVYRQNVLTIKRIRDEIATLERMAQPTKGMKSPDVIEKSRFKVNLPEKSTTWFIILIIVVFLVLLSGVFFFVWQAQIKSSQDSFDAARKDAFGEGGNPPEPKK